MASATDLRAIVGDDHVVDSDPADAIDGVQPRWVVRPGTVEEVSAVVALAERSGRSVTPRGGGTKLGLGNPPSRLDLVLDLARLDRIVEHATGDLVVSLEAGVPVRSLQSVLAGAGQMLALDIPQPGATAGGVIATNASGPRRLRYGTVRDLLIGVTIVLADGTVARAGGKVVKNVAGYDLSKLMTGSLGTLGIIVRANFRLHPVPPERGLVEFELAGPEAITGAVQRILHSSVVPSAIGLNWPRGGRPRLGVLLEGVHPSVVSQSSTTVELVSSPEATFVENMTGAENEWESFVSPPVEAGDVVIKVSCLPTQLSEVAALIVRVSRRLMDGAHLTGALGNGILEVHLRGSDPKGVAEVLGEIRTGLKKGNAVVTTAPLEVKRMVDVWGAVGDSLELMRRVKQRFDPSNTLNPGRFVGGI
jgi:glycolate oxidase FAD binding subunit